MLRMALSCLLTTSKASPMDAWGMVVGISRNEPSSRGGMNSLLMRDHTVAPVITMEIGRTRNSGLYCKQKRKMLSYAW